jgi:acyl carrier protein
VTSDIQNAVLAAIAKQKQLPVDSVSLDSTLESLSISSLDAITIVYEIEDIYDIEFPNEILDNLHNVQDIIDAISKLIPQ